MNTQPTEPQDGPINRIATAYKDYKQKLQALEAQQQALLHEAMGILQADKMQDARKKLEQMLHKL